MLGDDRPEGRGQFRTVARPMVIACRVIPGDVETFSGEVSGC
jgi:hypothetical protein